MTKKKLFIIVNADWFFLSHRLPIAIAAKKKGFVVTILAKDTGKRTEIENYGLKFIDIPFERAKFNPFKEYNIYKTLKKIYKDEMPDIVHHVTLKPIILGNLAAKQNTNISIINAISGLGILFSSKGPKLKRFFVLKLLKFVFSFKNRVRVIFQNNEDRAVFIDNTLIKKEQSVLIKGSGVDLNEYIYIEPDKRINKRIFMAARLLYPKGFKEFFLLAKYIKSINKFRNVDFVIAGDIDEINPLSISKKTINEWEQTGYIKWIGFVKNMKREIAISNIIVYPSYYGEGVPKFLIETCAIGRPIITTDHAGCRDCVNPQINGYLVPPEDYAEMAKHLIELLNSPELCRQFGKNSRLKAEREFNLNSVINLHMNIYEEIL